MKTVIVTGASGQLGQSISKTLLEKKYGLIGVDLNENKLLKKYKNYSFVKTDITSEKEVSDFYDSLKKENFQICGLVNNAGVAVFSPFEQRTEEELMFVTKVNNFAPVFMTKGFINITDKKFKPSIVNIASIYGLCAPDQKLYEDTPRNSSEIYGMTKAAMVNLTKYLSVYLAKYEIRCNCVSPGGILFEQGPKFIKNYSNKVPVNRMANVDEIVQSVSFLLDYKSSSYINGANIVVDGGFTAW